MPWYKLPHSNLVMWFDQKRPDLELTRKPRAKHVKPASKPEPSSPAAVDEWLEQVKSKPGPKAE